MGLTRFSSIVERGLAELVQRVGPSVVEVRHGHGIGSGIVWRADGLLVTNDHVAPGGSVTVGLLDGRQLTGQVVARDGANDLALVVVDERRLTAARHRANPARVGELVVALGHPFGERYAAATGIIAASGQPWEAGRRALIQADVPIGPGSSGGPLLDANGFVIGINAMVGGGMALAVPSTLAERLVQAYVGYAAA
ncbi:MAG: trypsin-like peptidase domain-containing protein [Chloroflexi bacterium]|nr:trypsin-like peptidase domain-containing protein [Chloroflexota bacterium]